MPDRLSYDDAMLYARQNLKIQEPDIKQGAVETIMIKTAVGDLKKPWGIEGGFAVVYKFRTLSGQMKAMRCFRVGVNIDTRLRYEKMSSYFRQHLADITVDFCYYEDGILVKETQQSMQKTVRPVIVMEWVEGVTLLDKVDELCRLGDTDMLGQLADQWLDMVNAMWQGHMAHGDLAGVNVMVRTNGQLALIDYDGVYIPDFSGMPQRVLGQQGYQHPDMMNRTFGEKMDDFSALVIYLSLLALQARPDLWDRYAKRNAKGQLDGNMLFLNDDFAQPNSSAVFADLLLSPDPQVRELALYLYDACTQPIDTVDFPTDLCGTTSRQKRTLPLLEQAIQDGKDALIVQYWDDAQLANYQPAQRYALDVEEARSRKYARDTFNDALNNHDPFQILDAVTPELLANGHIGTNERQIVDIAQGFVAAYNSNDDEQIIKRWQEIKHGPYRDKFELDPTHLARLQFAERRKSALARFRRSAYRGVTAHMILSSYDSILDGYHGVTRQERDLLNAAYRYVEMYHKVRNALRMNNGQGDIGQFLAAYDEALDRRFPDFNQAERQQIAALSRYGNLDQALRGGFYRAALVTARNIEKQTTTHVVDKRLSDAREQFMKGIEVRHVRGYVQFRQVSAIWEWPNDDLIDIAKIVWRYDRWPYHPKFDDPGRLEIWVPRGVYEQNGCFTFSVERAAFIQVYFALKDYFDQTYRFRWVYSPGNEPTSRLAVQIAS